MDRPHDIFDREPEWASLTTFAQDPRPGATLGLVYGRRRMGKSLLLESLCEATGGFYHQALEQDEALALAGLGEDLARHVGAPAAISFSGWEEAIGALLNIGLRGRGSVVVLDEFPYLVAASSELPSVIQRAFGARARARERSRTRLILCGSALSIMGRLLAGTAPLRGRAGLDMLVQPFDFRQAAGFWDLAGEPELALRIHAVLGGTPAYRELIRGDAPSSLRGFDGWVIRSILHPASPLFREGRYLLAEESGLADRALYHSILTAIAEGQTRPGQVAAVLRRPQTSLAYPMNVLEDLRLVRREEDAVRQRRPTYRLAEPIVRFYFAVMRRHLARLERGAGLQVWESDARTSFSSQVLGPHFEEVARTWTASYASAETMGGTVGMVGSTVVQDGAERASHEIDVVALAPTAEGERKRVLALGEAKWQRTPLGDRDLDRLRRVMRLLEAREDVDVSRARLMLFGRGRFSSSLRRRAGDGLVLVGLDRLYEGD